MMQTEVDNMSDSYCIKRERQTDTHRDREGEREREPVVYVYSFLLTLPCSWIPDHVTRLEAAVTA